MASKTAILAIRIIGDATEAVTSLQDVDGSAKSMQSTMDKASIGAGVALGALAAAATVAGNAASELEQATGAVDSVFGTYASKVHDYASTAADAVGLSRSQYENMSAVLGSQLKNMGVSLDEAGGQTQQLISLGADLSATFGGTTADAVAALSSLLRGERDPIERYGVSMNQAAIDAQKAAMGLVGLTGEADKNATLQATLALLTKQTADAQGQFGREAETAAGQQQRANAAWENAIAALGEQLLPVMTQGAQMLASWAEWAGENVELVTLLAGGIGVLAAGILIINGAMKAYAAIQAIQTAAQWANNAAWLASPITWIILAIAAAIALVIAIVVFLIQHWDEVQRVAAEVWGFVLDTVKSVGSGFELVFTAIGLWWDGLVGGWVNGFETFIGWIREALRWLDDLTGGAIPGWVKDLLGMSGRTASARMVIDQPTVQPAMMAFSAAEAVSAFSYNTAAPTAVAVPALADLGGLADARVSGGDTYLTVNFNGQLIDREGVARDIRELLDESDKTNGRVVAAGGSR